MNETLDIKAPFKFAGTDRFELLEKLGEGGMGVVYAAYDRQRETKVALKTIRRQDASLLLRFKNEFRAMQDIGHPNIVGLGELFEYQGTWFFTMEIIDGIGFVSHVRQAPAFDDTVSAGSGGATFSEARLRGGLSQLTGGLMAIHEAGRVHRDIKPSNVLVTKEGRVVILDFGLVHDLEASISTGEGVAGTAAYMAPEQATTQPVSPATDWYAVGVLLFECLTGRLPYKGSLMQIIMDKQQVDPPHPRELAANVPAELDELCRALLQFEPAARPSGAAILGCLGGTPPAEIASKKVPSSSGRDNFVGRQRELDLLAVLHEQSQQDGPVVVLVHGPSGVGKSELTHQFSRQQRKAAPETLVLKGRCLENEQVPFKALDGVVDRLTRTLGSLPKEHVLQVLPRHTDVLVRVFPVLGQVTARGMKRVRQESLEPHEVRALAFRALKALLAHLTDLYPLLLVIDDMQWADPDSRSLLRELLSAPDAPTCCLVVTLRTPEDEAAARSLVEQTAALCPCRTEEIRLECLSEEESRELAAGLLHLNEEDQQAARDRVEIIARETGGHPLFIQELVRHARREERGGAADGSALRLEDAIWMRVSGLEQAARRVLEVVSVAGAPVSQEIVMEASGQEAGTLVRDLSLLRVAHLLRLDGMNREDTVEPYHDRVRQSVLAHMTDEERCRWHGRLAGAMETLGHTAPERMAYHLRGAGETDRAARYTAAAAGQAVEVLAFDRAADLYRAALESWPEEGEEKRRLWVTLADTLANAGRSVEAAQAYTEAVPKARPYEALTLQCKVTNQLVRGGNVSRGMEVLARVARALGLRLPRPGLGALIALLLRRLRIRLRGVRFRERDEAQIPPEKLLRLDLRQQMALALSLSDHIRGADFSTRFALSALKLGEPVRVGLALATEATYVYSSGVSDSRYLRKLLDAAEGLLARLNNPLVRVSLEFAHMLGAFTAGRWRQTLEHADTVESLSLEERGMSYERLLANYFRSTTLAYMGELAQLTRVVPELVRDAENRGDLYAQSGLVMGQPCVVFLNREGPQQARRRIDEMMKTSLVQLSHLQRYDALFGQVQIDLYQGEGTEALGRVEAEWAPLRRSFLLTIPSVSLEAHHLRARALLAAASAASAAARGPLLKRARKDCRWMARSASRWNQAYGLLAEAGLAAQLDDPARARQKLEAAVPALDAAQTRLYAAAARRRLGQLLGGEQGRQTLTEGTAFMEQQGVTDVERMTRMLAPGFSDA